MPVFKKMLIPIDFSDSSHQALRQACDLSRRYDAELHLVHVLEAWSRSPPVDPEYRSQFDELQAEHRQRMEHQLEQLPDASLGPKPVVRALLSGNAPEEICNYADAHGIDLIVMGTHGRSGVARWLMGSVAEMVVRHAHCPVLVVRPSTPPPPSA